MVALSLMLAQRRKLKFFIDRVLRTCYIIVMISRTYLFFSRKWARLPVFSPHLLLITSTPHALVSFLPITIHFLFDLPIIRFQSIPHRSRTRLLLQNSLLVHHSIQFCHVTHPLWIFRFYRFRSFAFNTWTPPIRRRLFRPIAISHEISRIDIVTGQSERTTVVAAKVVEVRRSTRKHVFYFHEQTRPIDLPYL